MILAGISFSSCFVALARRCGIGRAWFRHKDSTLLPSVPMIFLIVHISFTYAQRGPVASPEGGGVSRVLLARRRRARLHPVGGVPADSRTRGRNRHDAARASRARGQPHGGGPDAPRVRR